MTETSTVLFYKSNVICLTTFEENKLPRKFLISITSYVFYRRKLFGEVVSIKYIIFYKNWE